MENDQADSVISTNDESADSDSIEYIEDPVKELRPVPIPCQEEPENILRRQSIRLAILEDKELILKKGIPEIEQLLQECTAEELDFMARYIQQQVNDKDKKKLGTGILSLLIGGGSYFSGIDFREDTAMTGILKDNEMIDLVSNSIDGVAIAYCPKIILTVVKVMGIIMKHSLKELK
jgi:hypothetical protein